MTLLRRSAFLTLALILMGGSARADDSKGISSAPPASVKDALSLLPVETEGVYYLNIEQALRSELSQKYLSEPLKTLDRNAGFKEFIKVTGLDPLKDLKLLVGSATRPREGQAVASHALMVLVGAFDREKLTAAARMAAAKEKDALALVREKGHTLLKVTTTSQAGKFDFYMAVVDQRRLVLGLEGDVLEALDRTARKSAPALRSKDIVNALTSLDASSVFAIYGPGIILANPSAFTGFDSPEGKWLHALAADPTTAKLLKKISTVRFDVQITAGVRFVLKMGMNDLDSAKEFKPLVLKGVNQIKLLLNLLILQQPKLKPLGELTQKMTVTRKGKAITFEASLSGKTIDELVKAARQKK